MRGRIGRGSQEASELREAAQLGIAFDPIAGCTGANSDTPEILTHTLGKHFDIEQEKSRKYRRLTSVKHTGQGAASGLRGTCDRHTLRTEQVTLQSQNALNEWIQADCMSSRLYAEQSTLKA